MNLASTAKIIRLNPGTSRSKVEPKFVPQPDSNGRALLEKETNHSADVVERVECIGKATRKTLLLGVDFGANQTRLLAEFPGVDQFYLRRQIPSVVAMLKPDDKKTFSPFLYFGEEGERKNSNFQTIRPWRNGEIADPVFAREFVRHLREIMQKDDSLQTRAVIPTPVTMSADSRHHFRQALRGFFDEIVFLPRPYLAALGLKRMRGMKHRGDGEDARDSLILDLGAGSTEICRVGKRYPSADEMSGVQFGGDHVDLSIAETLRQDCPALVPNLRDIQEWKDEFGFVGADESPVVVRVPIDGTEQSIDLSNALRRGCEVWVTHMMELLESQLSNRVDGIRDIFVCGGGSQMGGLITMLVRMLRTAGYEGLNVELIDEGKNSSLSAVGALEAARKVRDEQWSKFRF